MFCPVCGCEYRDDFTTCSDCQVALVAERPGEEDEAAFDEHDSFVLVWVGRDPRGHADVCELLASANIPARTISEQDHLIYATVNAPFEVFVPSAFAARAKQLLDEAHSSEEALEQLAASGALEIPAEDESESDAVAAGAPRRRELKYAAGDDSADDTLPAAAVVWTGEDIEVAQMIEASLRENAIHFRTISDGATRGSHNEQSAIAPGEEATSIFVLPEDEERAQRIIREITDATPPN